MDEDHNNIITESTSAKRSGELDSSCEVTNGQMHSRAQQFLLPCKYEGWCRCPFFAKSDGSTKADSPQRFRYLPNSLSGINLLRKVLLPSVLFRIAHVKQISFVRLLSSGKRSWQNRSKSRNNRMDSSYENPNAFFCRTKSCSRAEKRLSNVYVIQAHQPFHFSQDSVRITSSPAHLRTDMV